MHDIQVEICARRDADAYDMLFEASCDALSQQSTAWSDVISPIGPDTPYFLIAEDLSAGKAPVAGLPLYHFKGLQGGILTSVPQAGPLGGIFLRQSFPQDRVEVLYRALIETARSLARELQCVALTVITQPLRSDEPLYKRAVPPEYTLRNFTQIIDVAGLLTSNDEALIVCRNVRRNLTKARNAEIHVHWGTESDFEPWYTIHCKRHRELGVQPLPKALLMAASRVSGPSCNGKLAIATQHGKIIGGCLFIWSHKIGDAYIMSSDSEFLPTGVNFALTEFGIRFFSKEKVLWFNWQSSPRNSGVYTFKERWGSREVPYSFLTWTFPGFESVLDQSPEVISRNYMGHYVAPFRAIQEKVQSGVFEK